MKTFKDLLVWQKSYKLAVDIYKVTKTFPKEEMYGIVSQLRRSAVSIASNLAEGSKRGTKKDFAQFLRIAQGSGAELETQLLICSDIGYVTKVEFDKLNEELLTIMKMLTGLFNTTKE